MAFSDMLFGSTHNVEDLVNITKQKRVDKVLLKVVKTLRNRGNISGWIKADAHLSDLNMSDKAIRHSLEVLSNYYNLDMVREHFETVKDIVSYIKSNKANLADNVFLFDSQTAEDTDNEVQTSDNMEDPGLTDPKIIDPDEEMIPETEEKEIPLIAEVDDDEIINASEDSDDGVPVSTVEEDESGEITESDSSASSDTEIEGVSTESLAIPKNTTASDIFVVDSDHDDIDNGVSWGEVLNSL